MSKLDLKKPYGVIWGHDEYAFQQDGKFFDGSHNEVGGQSTEPVVLKSKTKVKETTPALNSASAFLLQILKENPLSKAAVYKAVESNNQDWNAVRDASAALGVVRYTQNTLEMWRLPESVA